MSSGKSGLILVITMGVCLLALFGFLLPLMVGQVAKTYSEYKSMKVYTSINNKTLNNKKPAPLTIEKHSPSQGRKKAVKEKDGQKVAQTPLPSLPEDITKEQKLPEVEKSQPKQPLEPSLPLVVDKEGKKNEAETVLENKDTTTEKTSPGEEERSTEPPPTLPGVAYVIPSAAKSPSQEETEKPADEAPYTMLPRTVDLKKDSRGVFPVGMELSQKGVKRLKPQISYWVGTSDASEFTDMQAEGGDLWRYEIPDLGWAKYRSQFLFYMLRIVNSEGDVVYEGKVEKELIDSFDKDLLDNEQKKH